MKNNSPKAIIVGASSGIGRALAAELHRRGVRLGVTARRTHLLKELAHELGEPALKVRAMDVCQFENARRELLSLIEEMDGIDYLFVNAGVNPPNPEFEWTPELVTAEINAVGFMAIAHAGWQYFTTRRKGHLIGVSSIAGLRGSPLHPSYSASKAYVSNYLEALRFRTRSSQLFVTDIRPGFVETDMIAGSHYKFWVASPETVARQIVQAVKKRRKMAYVTRRYGFVAFVYKVAPEWLLRILFKKAASRK